MSYSHRKTGSSYGTTKRTKFPKRLKNRIIAVDNRLEDIHREVDKGKFLKVADHLADANLDTWKARRLVEK